jgi:hypothetical protein
MKALLQCARVERRISPADNLFSPQRRLIQADESTGALVGWELLLN